MAVIHQNRCSKRPFLLFECIATVNLILSKVDQNDHYFGKNDRYTRMTIIDAQND